MELLAGTTTTTDASAADTARLKVLLFQILLGKIMVTSYYLAIFALSAGKVSLLDDSSPLKCTLTIAIWHTRILLR